MRLHKEDFEILKVIGRGAFGEVIYFPFFTRHTTKKQYTTLHAENLQFGFPPFPVLLKKQVLWVSLEHFLIDASSAVYGFLSSSQFWQVVSQNLELPSFRQRFCNMTLGLYQPVKGYSLLPSYLKAEAIKGQFAAFDSGLLCAAFQQ